MFWLVLVNKFGLKVLIFFDNVFLMLMVLYIWFFVVFRGKFIMVIFFLIIDKGFWLFIWICIFLFIILGLLGEELKGLLVIILIFGNKFVKVLMVVDFLVFRLFMIMMLLILGLMILSNRVNFILF